MTLAAIFKEKHIASRLRHLIIYSGVQLETHRRLFNQLNYSDYFGYRVHRSGDRECNECRDFNSLFLVRNEFHEQLPLILKAAVSPRITFLNHCEELDSELVIRGYRKLVQTLSVVSYLKCITRQMLSRYHRRAHHLVLAQVVQACEGNSIETMTLCQFSPSDLLIELGSDIATCLAHLKTITAVYMNS